MAGLLLAAGAMAFESLATPVLAGQKAWSRDAARSESLLSDDAARSEKYLLRSDGWWTLPSGISVGEVAADSGPLGRWAGSNDNPYGPEGYADLPKQFESAFNQNSVYQDLLRRRGAAAGHPGSELGLGGLIDSALRSAWDSVADDTNTANLSLAGLELSLTLRGDQRSLMINGYDVLPMLLPVTQGPESWQGPAPAAVQGDVHAAATTSVSIFAPEPSEGGNVVSDVVVVYKKVVGVATHPLTIFFVLTFLATWISVRVMQALRERRRSYRRYRRR